MTTSLAAGQIFANRYEVVRCIGSGGMGAVYEVIHLETERRRALKVMHAHFVDSPDFRERFKREARVAAQIDSDYIVDVFDAGVDEATKMPFLAMELLRGEELARTLKRVGRLAAADVVSCLLQTSFALDRTHKASIVHRDLKPENIFLCERDDGPPQIKVLDFGIAKFATAGAGQATNSVGTPLYMAPEQYLPGAEVTPAADIYALGLLAYTLLVGTDYWHEELERDENVFAFALIAMKGTVEAPSVRALRVAEMPLAPAFDAWFAHATALSPAARFATASEAVRELAIALRVNLPPQRPTAPSLQGILPELSIPGPAHSSRTTPAGSATTMQLRPERSKKRLVVGAAAGTILAFGLVVMAFRSGTAAPGRDTVLVAAAQPESPVPPEAVRAPLPAEVVAPAVEPDSKAAEVVPPEPHPASTAAKARPKATKPAPGTPAKPAPKPVYSRD